MNVNLLLLQNRFIYSLRNFGYFATLQEYKTDAGVGHWQEQTITNWGETNGINHTQVLNFNEDSKPVLNSNYLIVFNNLENIMERWFVIEFVRTRKNQYRLTLIRDVFADNRSWLKSDYMLMKIEKGSIKNATNKLILNSEGIALNRIKKEEIPLKQHSCQFIYFYMTKFQNKQIHFTSHITQKQFKFLTSSEDYFQFEDWFMTNGAYNIYCMVLPLDANDPNYKPLQIFTASSGWQEITRQEVLEFVSQLSQQIGSGDSGNIKDIQILPYAPFSMNEYDDYIRFRQTESFGFYLDGDTENVYCPLIRISDISTTGQKPNFTLNIAQTLNLQPLAYESETVEKLKMNNECEFYRLCSPNYNGQFDFSVAKNGGQINGFNVDVSLKPYSPYIHVNPVFNQNWLYGQDFDDARGLILQGDFSATLINSAWTQYLLQNKNYQNIFDREIQSMDTNHQYDKIGNVFSLIGGSISSGISGAVGGALVGGGVGAAIGGASGLVTSATGGVADLMLTESKFAEQKNLAIDKFNYQLDNIKALPYSLTKVDAFTYNNKKWPFVERYECSVEEINFMRNKIRKFGYTINTIDCWNKYDGGYIRGTLIEIQGIHDVDVINQIDKEFQLGFREIN